MNFIQKVRNLLDFIHDNWLVFGFSTPCQGQAFFPDQRRLMYKAAVFVGKEKVIAFGAGISLLE
jgi:hypothetical protein